MLNLPKESIKTSPFPYLLQKEVLDPQLFKELKDSYPMDNIWHDVRHTNNYILFGGRKDLHRGDPGFDDFVMAHPAWRELYHYVNSSKFTDRVWELFGEYVNPYGGRLDYNTAEFCEYFDRRIPSLPARVLNRLNMNDTYHKLKSFYYGNQIYINFDIAKAHTGYSREVHTDNRYKLISFLIYFDDSSEENYVSGGELQVFKHRESKQFSEYERKPRENDVELVTTIKPDANLGMMFLATNNSYHAVPTLNLKGGFRKFIYIGVCSHHTIWN